MSEVVTGTGAAERAGISHRKVQYWISTGLLTPVLGNPSPGQGTARALTGADVEALIVIDRLMRLREPDHTGIRDEIARIAAHVQRYGAVGTIELIPGVTVDLERLVADTEAVT